MYGLDQLVSLGGRAVGRLKEEVEDWINERIHLRPESTTGISERASEEGQAIPTKVLPFWSYSF